MASHWIDDAHRHPFKIGETVILVRRKNWHGIKTIVAIRSARAAHGELLGHAVILKRAKHDPKRVLAVVTIKPKRSQLASLQHTSRRFQALARIAESACATVATLTKRAEESCPGCNPVAHYTP